MSHVKAVNPVLIALGLLGIASLAVAARSMFLTADLIKVDQAEQGTILSHTKDNIFFCLPKSDGSNATFPLMDSTLSQATNVHFTLTEYTGLTKTGNEPVFVFGGASNGITEFKRGKIYTIHSDTDLFFRCNQGLSLVGTPQIASPSPNMPSAQQTAPASNCAPVQCAFPVVPTGCSYVLNHDPNGCPACGDVVCPNTSSADAMPTHPAANCPALQCPTPTIPSGCSYQFNTDANGCPACGSVVCSNASPVQARQNATAPASAQVTMTTSQATIQKGNVITMNIGVSNPTDTAWNDAALSLTMPSGYTIPPGVANGNCVGNGNAVSCQHFFVDQHAITKFTFSFVAGPDSTCDAQQTQATAIVPNGSDSLQITSPVVTWTETCSTSSAQQTSSTATMTTSATQTSTNTPSPIVSQTTTSGPTVNYNPLVATLSGPTGLQKNQNATYTLVLKNISDATLPGVGFTFVFPTGISTDAVSSMSNCAITATSMSCTGLWIQSQLSMTLTLPIKTLSTLPCTTIPLKVTTNVGGIFIDSNTINLQGCSGDSTASIAFVATIPTQTGFLQRNTSASLLTSVAAFNTSFTGGIVHVDFPVGLTPQMPLNTLNIGTCTSDDHGATCLGISRDSNKGASYTFPFTVAADAPCGVLPYTVTFLYTEQGIQKQMVKHQNIALCSAQTNSNKPLDQFSLETGTVSCKTADCRTLDIPVTLHNMAYTTATNVLVSLTADNNWSNATLNGAACQNVDFPTQRMIDCPGGPYLTIPAQTTENYTLEVSLLSPCPIANPRSTVLLQSAPASVYEEDYSDNSVYATLPKPCQNAASSSSAPIASSARPISSAASQPASSVSAQSAASSVVTGVSSATQVSSESICQINPSLCASSQSSTASIVTPASSAAPASSVAPLSSAAPASSAAASSAAPITLRSIVIKNGTVTIDYEKTTTTCAHLLTPNYQITHFDNIFCNQKGPISLPRSSFNSLLAGGSPYMLCDGNNSGICSAFVTAQEILASSSSAASSVAALQTDIGITMNSLTAAAPGTSVYYMLIIKNNGSVAASVHTADGIASGLSFDTSHSDTRCLAITQNGESTFSCNVGQLNPGQTANILVAFTLSANAQCGSQFTQMGTVLSNISDPLSGNNSAKATMSVICPTSTPVTGTPKCGNGIVEAFETCDDGNKIDTDACHNNCTRNFNPQTCGNGIREGTEQCDDGNQSNADSCSTKCTYLDYIPPPMTLSNVTVRTQPDFNGTVALYISGDLNGSFDTSTQRVAVTFADPYSYLNGVTDVGSNFTFITHAGYSKTYTPTITVTQLVNQKYITLAQQTLDPITITPPTPVFSTKDHFGMFATSFQLAGNLSYNDPRIAKNLPWTQKVDALCNMAAQDAGLSPAGSTVWHGLMTNPHRQMYPLYNMRNELLAQTENDLWSLQRSYLPAKVTTEYGNDASGYAWTGSDGTGKVAQASCNGWSTNLMPNTGSVGQVNGTGGGWYQITNQYCQQSASLYCVNDLTQ